MLHIVVRSMGAENMLHITSTIDHIYVTLIITHLWSHLTEHYDSERKIVKWHYLFVAMDTYRCSA